MKIHFSVSWGIENEKLWIIINETGKTNLSLLVFSVFSQKRPAQQQLITKTDDSAVFILKQINTPNSSRGFCLVNALCCYDKWGDWRKNEKKGHFWKNTFSLCSKDNDFDEKLSVWRPVILFFIQTLNFSLIIVFLCKTSFFRCPNHHYDSYLVIWSEKGKRHFQKKTWNEDFSLHIHHF